jgi:hypothetical protein
MQLPFVPGLSQDDVWVDRKAPNSLVLHAKAGNCIGDMASYDYFTLGGPYRWLGGLSRLAYRWLGWLGGSTRA